MTMPRVWLPSISYQEGLLADRPAAAPENFWLVWYDAAASPPNLAYSDGSAWISMGGGGGGGGLDVFKFDFDYTTASLNAGVDTGITVAAGDVNLFIFFSGTAVWDAVNPFLDLGVGVSPGGMGVNGIAFGSFVNLTTVPWSGAGGLGPGALSVAGFEWTTSGNIEIWVSQDALKNGTAPSGGTQGASTIYIANTTPI